jgi:hypothetical protein
MKKKCLPFLQNEKNNRFNVPLSIQYCQFDKSPFKGYGRKKKI